MIGPELRDSRIQIPTRDKPTLKGFYNPHGVLVWYSCGFWSTNPRNLAVAVMAAPKQETTEH